MFPRVLESLSLMVLWICTLVAVVALVGMVIAVVPLGWAPLYVYSCIGLWCAWVLYWRTVKPKEDKPVSQSLLIQCGFTFLVAIICFALGWFEAFGFDWNTSQVAGLPVVFFLLLMIRRGSFPTEPGNTPAQTGGFARILLIIAYLWMAIALTYFAACMAGTFITQFFEGVSLLVSPLNLVSWLVILGWFLPAFMFRALGRAIRKAGQYS